MKLSRALAMAARQMDAPPEQLRAIARTLAEREGGNVGTSRRPAPPAVGTATDRIDPGEHARSLSLSLQASHSRLTRTINLLK